MVHSITKYINGHSDVLAGAIITADPELITKFRFLQNAYGNVPSPFDCWLTMRGVKTLAIRMRQHGINTLLIANYLFKQSPHLVRNVYYPGLNRGLDKETISQRRERELAWGQMSAEAKEWVVKSGFTRDGEGGFPCSGMVAFHINEPGRSNDVSFSFKKDYESESTERFYDCGLARYSN